MKERNQLESEKLKRKREKAEEEKRKYKDKVPTNQRPATCVIVRYTTVLFRYQLWTKKRKRNWKNLKNFKK